ncbi:phospholipase D-like domain-containing protein [Pradoshia sp.]
MFKKFVYTVLWALGILLVFFALLLTWIHHDIRKGREAAEGNSNPIVYPVRQSDFKLYTKWDTFYPQFAKDIEEAKEYVYIHFFSIGSGEASKQYFDLLKRKANDGVEVYYSVDRAGSFKGNRKWFKELEKAGVHVTYSNEPHFPHLWYTIQHRNHRRIAVMDGKVAYTGGMNIGEKYTKSSWHDYQLRMTGEGIQDFEKQFCLDWKHNTGDSLPIHDVPTEGGATPHFLKSYTSGYGVVDDLIEAFDAAQKDIIIATPYFIPDNKHFMESLKEAKKRGVNITIMWPKHSDGLLLTQAAYPFVKEALQNGMNVYQYEKGIFHGKLVMIDRKYPIIGTVNIDSRSFRLNDEWTLFMDESPFTEVILNQVKQDLNDSSKITLDYFEKLSVKDKILMKIAKYVHYYL